MKVEFDTQCITIDELENIYAFVASELDRRIKQRDEDVKMTQL